VETPQSFLYYLMTMVSPWRFGPQFRLGNDFPEILQITLDFVLILLASDPAFLGIPFHFQVVNCYHSDHLQKHVFKIFPCSNYSVIFIS
jgi:hypothetical protein